MANKRVIAWAVAAVVCGGGVACAQSTPNADLATGLRQSEHSEQLVRQQTQRAADDLAAVIAEFEANGLGDGADVKVLKAIRGVLNRLSQEQMSQVITLLGQARQIGDGGQARQDVAAAFSGQKSIVLELQQLLLEYQRQEELATLSQRFRELAGRQNENLKAGATFYRATRDVKAANYDEAQRALLQVQLAEQNAIDEEVTAELKKLEGLQASVDAATAQKIKGLLEHAGSEKLAEALKLSSEDLGAGRFFSALSRERVARELLHDMARLAAPARDPISILRTAADQIERDTRQQHSIVDADRALAGTPEEKADKAAQLEDQQADLVDDVDQIGKDLLDVGTDALDDLKAAGLEMQQAREGLRKADGGGAADHGIAAAKGLDAAKQKIAEALSRLEKIALAKDVLTQTQALKSNVEALRKEEEKLAADTAGQKDVNVLEQLTQRQKALQKAAQDLAAVAAARGAQPEKTAAPLQEAARQMESARASLGEQLSANAAAPAQKSAVDALRQAEKQLDDQAAQLEQTKQDLAKLEAARGQVAKAVEAQQAVAAEALKAAREQAQAAKGAAATEAADPKALAAQQEAVGKKVDALRPDVAAAPEADAALGHAQEQMNNAQAAMEKKEGQPAAEHADRARAELAQAKTALDKKIADMQEKLGQPADPAGKLDEIAQKLSKAQEDLAKAEAPETGLADIQTAQKKIADQLDQMKQAGAPVDEARQAAHEAADQLAKSDADAAKKSMDKAAEGMRQALGEKPHDPAETGAHDPKAGNAHANEEATAHPPGEKPEAGAHAHDPTEAQATAHEASHGEEHAQGAEPPHGAGEKPEEGQAHAGQAHSKSESGEGGMEESHAPGTPGNQAQAGNEGGKSGQPEAGGEPGQTGQKAALSELAQQQDDLRQQLAEMSGAQSQSSKSSSASGKLGKVANDVTQAAAEDQGALPDAADSALDKAEQALANAAASAATGDKDSADRGAAQAKAQIAQAQAAIGMAQSGMQAQGQNAESPPSSDQAKHGDEPGKPNGNQARQGTGDRKDDHVAPGSTVAGAAPNNVNATFSGLPARDRAVIEQSQRDHVSAEYAPMVEQYLKNLSDQNK